jgi:hypothetical protein
VPDGTVAARALAFERVFWSSVRTTGTGEKLGHPPIRLHFGSTQRIAPESNQA